MARFNWKVRFCKIMVLGPDLIFCFFLKAWDMDIVQGSTQARAKFNNIAMTTGPNLTQLWDFQVSAKFQKKLFFQQLLNVIKLNYYN